ncbi:MAG: alpha-galactosidase, partial [Rhizobiaceae bacterium]
LSDHGRKIDLELSCKIDQNSDVLELSASIKNKGDSPFLVEWLCAPVVAPDQELNEHLSFHGRWCAEFSTRRDEIPIGQTRQENRRGRTSHEAFPGIVLLNSGTTEDIGPCMGLHLGWSGNHRVLLERFPSGDVQVQLGILLLSGEGELQPGSSTSTPTVYCAHSENGLNGMSQKFHTHIRKNLLKFPEPDLPRPVTVNTWEAIYFDHDKQRLIELADAAADIGAERFVIDDGWFRGRNDDTAGLGDWYPDKSKYPDGLGPIADHVRSRGMQFGLWVEPEMINPDSDLYRAHPDWVLALENYPQITGRNQLVLDLTNKAVNDYLFERLGALIVENGISYLKWDMNRDHALPADASGKASASDQVRALYHLIDRLLSAHSKLEIESCASGGGRVDYGILTRTHRFWPSDSNDPIERTAIQRGFSHFFPPEVMGAHIGPQWSHTSGRGFHIGFRALVSSYGHMGVEADLTRMSNEDRETIREAIACHKQDRDIWHAGQFYRISTVDQQLTGVASVKPDKTKARIVLCQTDRPRSSIPPKVKVRGLAPDRMYRVQISRVSEMVERANRSFDNPIWPAGSDGYLMDGATIQNSGISLPALFAETGLAVAIDAREDV